MGNKQDKLSVFISLILRHKPQVIGITLDEQGYANVADLIKGVKESGRDMDTQTLKAIVQEDKKGRYGFNEDMTLIRANQGHSLNVNVSLSELKPPSVLYHGTAKGSLESIQESGIQKMSRLHVHLSDNKETALQVGKRHGSPVILTVDSERMHEEGHRFFLSLNNVWLVDGVPNDYLVESI